MFALERMRVIKRYLSEHRQAEVHALSDLLDVSEVTIRRDLEKLEEDGFLVRTHGGALLVEDEASVGDEDDASVGDEANLAEASGKPQGEAPAASEGALLDDEVGRNAARLVSGGDTVMIVGGRLTRALARALTAKSGVTVLTNDLVVARELASRSGNRVTLLGGDLDPKDLAVYGALTQDDLQRFHVDRLFAELDGFGDGMELSSSTQQKAALIREGRERAREFVMLCPADRFYRNAFFRFGAARSGDTIVTDRTLGSDAKRRLFDADLRLFTALDVFEGSA